jgi:hypothetical protein
MFQSKVRYADWQTPEQREVTRRQARRDDAAKRTFNNLAGFWQVCEKPLCRRNRCCSHDMYACFERRWRPMPEEAKEYWRGILLALKTTRDPRELDKAGLARQGEYRQNQARAEAAMAQHRGRTDGVAPTGTATAEAPIDGAAPLGPRLRQL